MLCRALAGDQVGHGLGLAQVHLPVQEGALREFTRQGHARTGAEQGLQQALLHIGGAVHGELREVLSGV